MAGHTTIPSVKLIFSGNDFFLTLEKCISNAKKVIHFQTYIFEEDETGSEIIKALAKAVKRNVRVYLLADAYGSKGLSIEFIKKIQDAGIQFRLFSPLFSRESIYLGRRLHHKIIVIDSTTAIVGGINIGNRYHGSSNTPAWLDYAVLINGEICAELHTLCEQLYLKKRFRRTGNKRKRAENKEQLRFIRFSQNDWVKGRNEIYKSCLHAIVHAEHSIVIIASYFLPGYIYRRALKNARKRGVDVKIILAGRSDMPMLFHAEKHLYDFFIRNEIEIYEWPSSVLHGKALVTDEEWVSIGSYNMNYLSHYRSIELNAEIKDEELAKTFLKHIGEITAGTCILIDPEELSRRSGIFARIRNGFAYFCYRMMMKIFVKKKRV